MNTLTKEEKKKCLDCKGKGKAAMAEFNSLILEVYDELFIYVQNIRNIQQKLKKYNKFVGVEHEIPELVEASKAVHKMFRHFEFMECYLRSCKRNNNLPYTPKYKQKKSGTWMY